MLSPVFSSNRSDWETPPALFAELDQEFHFTIDVAATPENALCERYYTELDNGLIQRWDGEIVFCNPPYGAVVTDAWVEKASQIERGIAVLLLAARTDTRRFHNWIYHQAEIRFIKGRLRFGRPGIMNPGNAPFPSMIVIYHHLYRKGNYE